MNKEKIVFSIIMILTILFVIFMWNSPGLMPADLSEYYFCKDLGFQADSNYGEYKQYKDKDYGRIDCGSCYVEGCFFEYFNVTKDWRGNLYLIEDDAETRQDVQ